MELFHPTYKWFLGQLCISQFTLLSRLMEIRWFWNRDFNGWVCRLWKQRSSLVHPPTLPETNIQASPLKIDGFPIVISSFQGAIFRWTMLNFGRVFPKTWLGGWAVADLEVQCFPTLRSFTWRRPRKWYARKTSRCLSFWVSVTVSGGELLPQVCFKIVKEKNRNELNLYIGTYFCTKGLAIPCHCLEIVKPTMALQPKQTTLYASRQME